MYAKNTHKKGTPTNLADRQLDENKPKKRKSYPNYIYLITAKIITKAV